jgi:hypothetical protein
MWPDDDDARTAAAIEKKLEEVFRYGKFETLRWRGASDAWLEKWWPRFEAASPRARRQVPRREVPVVDAEGLAIATGAEIRGAVDPPADPRRLAALPRARPGAARATRRSRRSASAWWGRKIPQNLLPRK